MSMMLIIILNDGNDDVDGNVTEILIMEIG